MADEQLQPPLEDPPEKPPIVVVIAPPKTEEPPVDAPKSEGMFRFKPDVYEGRRFDGTLESGTALYEWSGKTSVQMTPAMNIVRVPTGSGVLACYPGQWIMRHNDEYFVMSEMAVNSNMEEVV